MPSQSPRRRDNKTAIQSLLGVLCVAAWMLVDQIAAEDASIGRSFLAALPCLVAFEAGVFSRYLPGITWIAKRIK